VEGQNNFHKYRSPYLQWANTLDFGRVRLNIVPTAILNCRPDDRVRLAPEVYVNPKSNHTLALGLGADIALHPRFSLAVEYVPRLAGFGGLAGGHSQVGGGMAIRTLGHVFTILVSTSRDFTPGLYGVNAQEQDVSLGFNIYRRIR
jgi:hypothetical protein